MVKLIMKSKNKKSLYKRFMLLMGLVTSRSVLHHYHMLEGHIPQFLSNFEVNMDEILALGTATI